MYSYFFCSLRQALLVRARRKSMARETMPCFFIRRFGTAYSYWFTLRYLYPLGVACSRAVSMARVKKRYFLSGVLARLTLSDSRHAFSSLSRILLHACTPALASPRQSTALVTPASAHSLIRSQVWRPRIQARSPHSRSRANSNLWLARAK